MSDGNEADRTAIGLTLTAFVDAWNAHDAGRFALTFSLDADFTNVVGVHAHGRAGVEAFHTPAFATIFKDSHLTGTIRSIRFLTPEFAAVDVDWQMTGAVSPDGTPISLRRGLLDWITRRQSDGAWLIEIMHNTDLPPVDAAPPQ